VEVYAIGNPPELEDLRQELARGPRAAWVSGVAEEPADVVVRYSDGFSIESE
jgi:acylphosphatase